MPVRWRAGWPLERNEVIHVVVEGDQSDKCVCLLDGERGCDQECVRQYLKQAEGMT